MVGSPQGPAVPPLLMAGHDLQQPEAQGLPWRLPSASDAPEGCPPAPDTEKLLKTISDLREKLRDAHSHPNKHSLLLMAFGQTREEMLSAIKDLRQDLYSQLTQSLTQEMARLREDLQARPPTGVADHSDVHLLAATSAIAGAPTSSARPPQARRPAKPGPSRRSLVLEELVAAPLRLAARQATTSARRPGSSRIRTTLSGVFPGARKLSQRRGIVLAQARTATERVRLPAPRQPTR